MRSPSPFRPARALPSLALALALAGCASTSPPAGTPAAEAGRPGTRTAVILAINDVYRIEGVEGGRLGGIARVRALREELERRHPDLLVLHGGDLLFPSFLSRTYNGAQMIDMLNWLDGDPAGFDSRMFAVLGNHEFEKDKKEDADLLDRRIEGSQFSWLGGNVTFAAGPDGSPVVAAPHLGRSFLVESGGIKIGIFGLTTDVKKPAYVTAIADPAATARALTADLRAQGAEVVVGLTHLAWQIDKKLLEELGDDGPDLIIGGHDHEHMAIPVGRRQVLKADADARTATVAVVSKGPDGRIEVASTLRKLEDGARLRPDRKIEAEVREWLACHERQFCADAGSPRGCLGEVIGRTKTVLVAEESKIRSVETSLGDWVADQMLAAFRSCGAQAAFINSGSLRLNQDLPAGTVTRRDVEELFAYPTPLVLLEVNGATLEKVAARSVQAWPGSGNWLQIAGFAYVHDSSAGTASAVTLLQPAPHRVAPDETVLVVTNDYVAGGGDGYTMLKDAEVVPCAVGTPDLKVLVGQALRAAEPAGIAPAASDGRICAAPPAAGCRALP